MFCGIILTFRSLTEIKGKNNGEEKNNSEEKNSGDEKNNK